MDDSISEAQVDQTVIDLPNIKKSAYGYDPESQYCTSSVSSIRGLAHLVAHARQMSAYSYGSPPALSGNSGSVRIQVTVARIKDIFTSDCPTWEVIVSPSHRTGSRSGFLFTTHRRGTLSHRFAKRQAFERPRRSTSLPCPAAFSAQTS